MPTSGESLSKLSRLLSRPWVVAGLYLLLAIVMTFPLALNLASSLPAGSGDVWQNYWNFWWWKKCFLALQSPYHSQLLFYPSGADLIFHTHSPFNMITAMPANILWGPAAAYNFSILVALWLSGWGMFLLVREITGEVRGAFLAGLVFAFFPQHMEQTLEHVNLASTQFLPLAILYFLRLARAGGARNIVALGLCFALNALCSWHLGLMLILALAPLAAVDLVRKSRHPAELLRDWAFSAGISTLVVLPAALPLVRELFSRADYFYKPLVNRGIDAAYLFIPFYEHPLWKGLLAPAYVERAYQAAGFVCYLGFVPVALAVWAVLQGRRDTAYWGMLSLAGLVLALGTHPFWNGDLYENITLPFVGVQFVPVLNFMRVANRFLILSSMGLAVLAGVGWSALGKRDDRKFLILAGLVFFEYLWTPYPIQNVNLSPLYGRIAQAGGQGAVLDIPFQQRSLTVHNNAAQTVHQRPIADGYLSNVPPDALRTIREEPALAELAGVPQPQASIDRERLLELGFEWVVLHKYRKESYRREALSRVEANDILGRKEALRMGRIPDETMERIRRQLTRLTGGPSFEDNKIAVFDLRKRSGEER